MSSDAQDKRVFVNDGDTIIVVAKTQQDGPSVSDPCDAYPYLSQAYRVVSDRVGSTLALVPLGTRAVRVSQNEIDQFIACQTQERAERVEDAMAMIIQLIKESGWKVESNDLFEKIASCKKMPVFMDTKRNFFVYSEKP